MLWMKMQVPTMSIKLQWVISYTLILGMTNFLMKFNQKPEATDVCSMRSSGRRKRMVLRTASTPVKAHHEKQKLRRACTRPATGPLLSGLPWLPLWDRPFDFRISGPLPGWGSGRTTGTGWQAWLLVPPCRREALNPFLWSLSQWFQF